MQGVLMSLDLDISLKKFINFDQSFKLYKDSFKRSVYYNPQTD